MSASPSAQWSNPGWWAALWALAWLLGLALQLQQPVLWPAAGYGGLASLALLLVLACMRGQSWGRLLPGVLLALALSCLAFASTGWRADARLAQRLAPALEGQDLLVTGVVASLPQVGASGLRFRFEVEHAVALADPQRRPVALPPLLALGWYNNFNDEALLDNPRSSLRAGQRWRLPLRLKLPHGALNPAGFDAELLWFEQGLGATGYVRVARAAAPGANAQWLADGAGYPVDRLRQTVRDAIDRQVPDPRSAGVLAALAVGDQGAIERADWEVFRQTGIAHLVSISGVHVTMFAWLAGLGVSRLWRRSQRAMHWLPAPAAGRWLGLAAATSYAVLAGWGVPAQRTVIMLLAAGLLRAWGQRWPWPLVLLGAAVVVTLIDPWALLQPGFWLSFMAVGLLMASEPASGRLAASQADAVLAADRQAAAQRTPQGTPQGTPQAAQQSGWHTRLQTRLHGPLREHLRGQVLATLGLAPLSLVFFQQLSVVGFLANLVAIPLVTLLITPLALLGMLIPLLWTAAALLVQALVWGLGHLAHWPFAVYSAPVAPAWALACGLAGAVLGSLPLPWRVRWLAAPLVLPLLWPPVQRPDPGSFELLAADIGQGTAVLVRTHGHLLLYDTGPQYTVDTDAGQRVLLPLLQARGEPRIDMLLLSHRDTDHVGGAASVLAGHQVAALRSSLEPGHPLLLQAARRGVPHTGCAAGQAWDWDGVRFELLHPLAADLPGAAPGAAGPAASGKPNALSCVLRVVDSQGRSALLTGDIETPQEVALLQRLAASTASSSAFGNTEPAAATLASSVLLVPHHGSRTSSSAAFLDAVQPRTAVVQAGYRSRYGHPAADVLARYTDRGISVVRSDQCGAWQWQDGASRCTRQVRRRYWHWAAPVGGAIVATHDGPGANTP